MNDVAAICSGLIRLSIATRNLRATRSTLTGLRNQQPIQQTKEEQPIRPSVILTAPSPLDSSKSFNSNPKEPRLSPREENKVEVDRTVATKHDQITRSIESILDHPIPKIATSPSPSPSPPPPPPTQPVLPEPSPPIVTQVETRLDDRPAGSESRENVDIGEQVVEINNLRSSKVPSSRLGRLMHYGGLAAGLGYGMASEAIRRTTYGPSSTAEQPGLLLSEANIERLVNKLSKMRGAALKLGQFLSIQDTKLLSPQLEAVLHRVQNSANYMPEWQTERVLSQDLGPDWQQHFESFEMRPFAAASIGQVHSAVLSADSPFASKYGSSLKVAVKVQFPGVRQSISSDLSNLKWLLLATSVLPRGLYLDNTLKVLERELVDECNYEREADFGHRMGELIKSSKLFRDFAVPRVVKELSGSMVLTTEMMYGKPLKAALDVEQEKRDWIGTRILDLCLHELFSFRIMQTDPNWSNFLYNERTKKIELIDFGASQEYSERFIENYGNLLSCAVLEDREGSIRFSRELGYFTGEENEEMISAHLTSLFALALPFRRSSPSPFPFGTMGPQITATVRSQIPIMLKHRLTPPPEETYSLNRKLSGAFLLCERLAAHVDSQEMYRNAVGR